MITCAKCGASNPLTTMFCRQCGTKMTVNYQQIAGAVAQDAEQTRDRKLLNAGINALPLCVFLLVAALVVRYVAVPVAPPPRVGDAPAVELFTGEPTWAAATASATTPSAADLMPAQDRLGWRQQLAPNLLSSFSLDLAALQAQAKRLAALQKPDGSFPGGDDMAATALMALALQAYPASPELTAAAARARGWLDGQWRTLSRRPALARALAVLALADAEALTEEKRSGLGALLIDGAAPIWQASLLAMLPPAARPTQTVAIENRIPAPFGKAWLALIMGGPTGLELKDHFAERAKALTTGEERMLWAQVAWFHPLAPDDLAETLRQWAAAAPAPVDPALGKACGAEAATAVHLLTLTAPLRLPALQLSR